jgi:nucleotide-binding universal stress UspA family protein
MKNILVATDFSSEANNACHYVIEMYKDVKLKINLIHVAPMQYVDEATLMSVEVLIEASKKQLQESVQGLKTRYSDRDLIINPLSKIGSPKQNILSALKEDSYDLLVMGMKGMSAMEKILIGSTAASLVRSSLCDTLVVPGNVKFDGLDQIIFATDYKTVENKTVFKPVKELAQMYQAEISFINVNHYELVPTFDESYEGLLLDDVFKGIKHSFHHSEEDKIEEGISNFIEEKNGDMLVMMPHKHDFFERLVQPSHTKKMVYNIKVPLLILHEKG